MNTSFQIYEFIFLFFLIFPAFPSNFVPAFPSNFPSNFRPAAFPSVQVSQKSSTYLLISPKFFVLQMKFWKWESSNKTLHKNLIWLSVSPPWTIWSQYIITLFSRIFSRKYILNFINLMLDEGESSCKEYTMISTTPEIIYKSKHFWSSYFFI